VNRMRRLPMCFPQNTIFFNQIFDHLLLAFIDPTGQRDNKK